MKYGTEHCAIVLNISRYVCMGDSSNQASNRENNLKETYINTYIHTQLEMYAFEIESGRDLGFDGGLTLAVDVEDREVVEGVAGVDLALRLGVVLQDGCLDLLVR